MKKYILSSPLISGLLVGLLAMFFSTSFAFASPTPETDPHLPGQLQEIQDCKDCHLDIEDSWSHSPHAHAYDDPVFQDRWLGLGEPDNCLACHTTNFTASTAEYDAEGVSCQACHNQEVENHPPEIIPTNADSEYCGSCHTTTLSEWRTTGHALADVGCMDCHDPHSQEALFENPDDLCINCHREGMGDYLNDLHVTKDIGCVDCHALVIPPEVPPQDGIVPTGHAFDITPQTCVACHTDTLHAGFTLPGYENGASNGFHGDGDGDGESVETEGARPLTTESGADQLNTMQRIQALETALASSRVSNLFQGAVIGLVLGGSTAWIVARNVRGNGEEEETSDVG